MDKKIEPSCASCVNEIKDRICLSETGKGSKGCPTLISKEILKKANLKYEDKDKIFRGTDESMCNPIFQAEALNEAKVDLNVLLGLCVGHDVLFFQHSKIPTTVLAVKDRVTGHNPLAAIYNADSYYQKIKKL